MYFRYMIAVVLGILLISLSLPQAQAAEQLDPPATLKGVRITPDVAYGHKYGMALTFDESDSCFAVSRL